MNRNQRGQHLRLMGFLHYVLWIVIAVTTICLVQVPMRSMADGFTSQRTSRAKKVNAESRVAKTQPSSETQPVTTEPSELPADEAIVEVPPQRKASEFEAKQDDAPAATLTSESEIPRRVFASQSTSPSNEEGLANHEGLTADDAWPSVAPAKEQDLTSVSSGATNGSDGTPESPSLTDRETVTSGDIEAPLPEDTSSEQANVASSTSDVAGVSGLATEGVVASSEDSFETALSPSAEVVPDESSSANASDSLPQHPNRSAGPDDSNDGLVSSETKTGLLEKLWSDKNVSLEALVESYKSPWPRALEAQGATTEPDAGVASEPASSDDVNALADGLEASTTERSSPTATLATSTPAQGTVADTPSVASQANEVAPPANGTKAPEAQASTTPSTASTSQAEIVSEAEPMLPANAVVKPVVPLEITIENPAAYRTPLQFVLNDQVVTLASGKVHTVTPSDKPVVIRYHRGGNQNLEDQQTLHAGRYQFVVRRVGWDLKRLESEGR